MNIENCWNSFCYGKINVFIMWGLTMLMVMFFGIGQSEQFIIVGWVITTIVALLRLFMIRTRIATPPTTTLKDRKYLDPIKLQRLGEILSAYEHKNFENNTFQEVCQRIRDANMWIENNNTLHNKQRIDCLLDEVVHDMMILSINNGLPND